MACAPCWPFVSVQNRTEMVLFFWYPPWGRNRGLRLSVRDCFKSRRGLSLLEVLFTIGLLTVVLVAFAAVYPSGFRLNRKSAQATVAAETAAAVAAEIQGLAFFDTRVVKKPPITTLTDIDTSSGDRTGLTTYLNNSLRTPIPSGYVLLPQGVNVYRFI